MRNKLLVASALSAMFALVCSDSDALNRLGGRQVGPQQNEPSVQVSPERQEAERQIAEKFNRIDPYKDDPSKSFINRYIKREGSYERLVEFFTKNPGEPEREVVVRKIFDGSTERTLEKFNRVVSVLREQGTELEQKLEWINGKSGKAAERIRSALQNPFEKRGEVVQLIDFIDSINDVGDESGRSFVEITLDVYKKLSANIASPSALAGQVKITEPFEKFRKKLAESVPLRDASEGENCEKWASILSGSTDYISLIPLTNLSEGLDILVKSLLYPYKKAMKQAWNHARRQAH
ncbi:MAG: hypothetical protein IJA14_05170 [Alphaproteobacteria bacterium]|nr:hypothetical protein [Alphaproteobacteria bacterium]